MSTCLRCGFCCYLKDDNGNLTKKKCRFLVILKSGKTICRIYKNRLGTDTGNNNVCTLRVNDKHNYPGCPYNEVKNDKS